MNINNLDPCISDPNIIDCKNILRVYLPDHI